MLLARTDAAATSNAPTGLFGADVLCGDRSLKRGHGRMSPIPRVSGRTQRASEPTRPSVPAPQPARTPANAGGAAARVWAAYVVGRALGA